MYNVLVVFATDSGWGSIPDWISLFIAFISCAVAVTALFWPRLERRFWHSRLSLTQPEKPSIEGDNSGNQFIVIKLLVKHSTNWPVHNVKVWITKIEYHYTSQKAYRTGPVPLKWQAFDGQLGERTIGMSRICDLGKLLKSSSGGDPVFTIEIQGGEIAEFPHEIKKPFWMRFHLIAEGDDGKSKPLCLEVDWDGKWPENDEALDKHLVLKSLNSCSCAI